MVVVQDVREFLNNLSSQLVPDATIEKQIDIARTRVESEKAAGVAFDTLEEAKLVFAGYLTYLAYVTGYERSVGIVPGFMVGHLQSLKELAETFIRYVRTGAPAYTPPVTQAKTIRELYVDGELEGDKY